MRHKKAHRHLNRTSNHRRALRRNLARAFFKQFGTDREYIVTTLPKAKEYQPYIEKIITLGKKGELRHRRKAMSKLPDKAIIQKVFDEIAPRYADRPGGYTRIIKTGAYRKGDGSRKVLLQFVEETEDEAPVAPEKA